MKYRKAYTSNEKMFIRDSLEGIVQKYINDYAAGLTFDNFQLDHERFYFVADLLKFEIDSAIERGQLLGFHPRDVVAYTRAKLPSIYTQDILLNPALLSR